MGNPLTLAATQGGSTATTYYAYDPYDRLIGAWSLPGCTGTGLSGVGYAYDPEGGRTAQTRYSAPTLTTTYRYNADDHLCWSYVGTSSNGCATVPPRPVGVGAHLGSVAVIPRGGGLWAVGSFYNEEVASNALIEHYGIPFCSDGVDNDDDGAADYPDDPGSAS